MAQVTVLGTGRWSTTARAGLSRLRPAWVRGVPWPLGLLLLAGVALRLLLIHAQRPGFLGYPDAVGYVAAARLKGPAGLLFYDPYRPAGYPLFLSWLHGITPTLGFVVTVQHLMGLAMAGLLYATTLPFVERRWIALIPVVVILFSGSELFLEHSALSEPLYTTLVVAALFCASRAIRVRGAWDLIWLAAAGALMGFSVPVRSAGILVVPALVLWAIASRPGWRRRLLRGAVTGLACAAAVFSYLAYQHHYTHTWSLTRTTGETLYARSAVFANCRDFRPPAGTRILCQPRPTPDAGANFYMFGGGPVQAFGPPSDPRSGGGFTWKPDAKLEQFGIDAILAQPTEFVWTTLQGLVGYVDPAAVPANMLDTTQVPFLTTLEAPPGSDGPAEVAAYYPRTTMISHHTTLSWLSTYARAARVEGPVGAVLVVLLLVGLALARGSRRAITWLAGTFALFLMVTPVAALFYGVRYATPSYGPLAVAAALGLDLALPRARAALTTRRRRLRTETAA